MSRLYDVAHAHAGGKGNRCSISVIIPYDAAVYPLLVDFLTEELVAEQFRHRTSHVTRYQVDTFPALNFVLENALEGGVNRSLGLDGHGQSLSFHMFTIELPR